MKTPTYKDVCKHGKHIKQFISVEYPELYDIVKTIDGCTFSEKLYIYYFGRGYCLECGAPTKFFNFQKGFRNYCSPKCARNSQEVNDKLKIINQEKYGGIGFASPKLKRKAAQTNIERYGSENPFGSPQIQEQIKQTNLERYGVEHPLQSKEIQDKQKQTCLERYGESCCLHSPEIQEKVKQTNLERYGSENPFGSPLIREKSKQTCLERYGAEYAHQTEEVKDKIKKSTIKHFGVPCSLQSEEVRNKGIQTNLEKYGVEHYSNQEQAKQTNLERYGSENPFGSPLIREKSKQTCLERYGAEYAVQSPDIKEKSKQTCLLHHGVEYPTQSIEVREKIVQTCIDKYGVPYGFLNTEPGYSKISQEYFRSLDEQYPNAMYATKGGEYRVGPYLLDWYDPDSNTVIEFNGDYWHANPKLYSEDWIHPKKQCTAQSIWDKDKEKIDYLKSLGYNVKIIWESDVK